MVKKPTSYPPETIEFITACTSASKEAAIHALQQNGDSAERAIEYILSGGVINVNPPSPTTATASSEEIHQRNHSEMMDVVMGDSRALALVPTAPPEDDQLPPNKRQRTQLTEEEQIKEAINASLKEQSKPIPAVKATNEEADLSAAIEMSLKDQKPQQAPADVNPRERLRPDLSLPIGLRNIGNTCYINSLLQSYFSLPQFRRQIFSYVPSTAPPTQSVEALPIAQSQSKESTDEFIQELQRLFAQLALSNEKFVDPSQLVNSMQKVGVSVKIGAQQDVSEFNDLFISKIEDAFKAGQSASSDIIKQMFYGKVVEHLSAVEFDGSAVNLQKEQEYGSLILNVSKELNDIYASLDHFTSTETVEYKTEKNFNTTATKSAWIKSIPPILLVQIQRTAYNSQTQLATKIELPFQFNYSITLDRYLEKNKEITKERRQRAAAIREKILQLEEQLSGLKNYKNKNFPLDEMISGSLDYLNEHLAQVQEPHSHDAISVRGAIKVLQQAHHTITSQIAGLQSSINVLNNQMHLLFDDMKEESYLLHAVLVHEGSPFSGHYWSYYYDRNAKKWWKFNDRYVSEVTEAEVWQRSIGGHHSSAYCLVYKREKDIEMLDSVDLEQSIPEQLRNEILEHNNKLLEDISKYEQEQQLKKQKELEQIQQMFKAGIEAIPNAKFGERYKLVYTTKFEVDDRITSLPAMLAYIGEYAAAKLAILEDSYNKVTSKHLSELNKASSSPADKERYQEVLRLVNVHVDQLVNHETLKHWRQQHSIFFMVTRLMVMGLKFIAEKEYEQGVGALQLAILHDSKLHTKLRRHDLLITYLAICIEEIFTMGISKIKYFSDEFEFGAIYCRMALELLPVIVSPNTAAYVKKHIITEFLNEMTSTFSKWTKDEKKVQTMKQMESLAKSIDLEAPPKIPDVSLEPAFAWSIPVDAAKVVPLLKEFSEQVEQRTSAFLEYKLAAKLPFEQHKPISIPEEVITEVSSTAEAADDKMDI